MPQGVPDNVMENKVNLNDEEVKQAAGGAFIKDGFKHDAVFGVKAGMCVSCGACIEVCPAQCITLNPFATIDRAYCTMCGSCENTCPYDAIGWTEVLTKIEE